MADMDIDNAEQITTRLREHAIADRLRITIHAHQEMIAEGVVVDDIICVLRQSLLVENYPTHKRGPCCLVAGQSSTGRTLHVVCTTSLDITIIITVYEPKSPKWITPLQRGKNEM